MKLSRHYLRKLFKTKYGYFTEDGKEYVITRPDTPRPWINVICPKEYGIIISQSGSGYSWYKNAALFRITRWEQDLVRDNWGKYIYARDNSSKQIWSIAWMPACKRPDSYECRHGIGYTTIASLNYGVKSEMTVFVPPEDSLEIWFIKLKNENPMPHSLTLFSYFEWFLGNIGELHRELYKLFIDTEYDEEKGIIFARKNGYFSEYIGYHTASMKPVSFDTDKETFAGMYAGVDEPLILKQKKCVQRIGRGNDAIACLQIDLNFNPYEEKKIVFLLGVETKKQNVYKTINKYNSPEKAEKFFEETKKYWENLISKTIVETEDDAFNIMTNIWLKYQSISCRLNGRTAYYQLAGGIGFRDQLQDSQIFLPLEPERTKKQILLHAQHQYRDGTVQHWWHPVTEEGPKSKHSDDLLWLVYVTINYIKETADFDILKEKVPFLDDKKTYSVYEHCTRAIDMVLSRFSKRGLPLIGEGDWNDGLSNLGKNWKGESIWLAEFLHCILNDWCELLNRKEIKNKFSNMKSKIKIYNKKAKKIKDAVNKLAWDGSWYICATSDSGEILGNSKCKECKIYLNTQTWAIISGIASSQKIKKIVYSLEKYLYRDYGPILFYPAFKQPNQKIGYITNYAPGARENGGVYTHAATWAILAECKLKRSDKAWELYKKICPIHRGMKPEIYLCEPYVTPGNSDGPDSQYYGRGGWTWYTGSSAWLFKVSTEWILGIRPTYEGLIVDPCIPSHWSKFRIKRYFRNSIYEIEVSKSNKKEIIVDSEKISGDIIPVFSDGKIHKVKVLIK